MSRAIFPAVRYRADDAEEHPEGNLVGAEAVAELEDRIEELYEEGTELFDAAEALARAVEAAIKAGHCGGRKIEKALEHFRTVTGG